MDSLLKALSLLSLGFIAFVAGAWVVFTEIPPYGVLRQSHLAASALIAQARQGGDVLETDLWVPADTAETGVVRHVEGRALQGYTLYTSGHAQKALLIDMAGEVVHEWRLPFGDIWDSSSPVRSPQPPDHIYFRHAELLPNGDLIALYIGAGDTPWGYGLARMDRDSKLIWKYLGQAHHDFDIGPDGRVYVLTHEIATAPIEGYDALKPPRIDDFLMVLDEAGRPTHRINLLQALSRSPYGRLLHTLPAFATKGHGDYLHTNTVELIRDPGAGRFPFGEAGDVLLSFRDMGLLAVLDPGTESIKWVTRGPWLGQHDPDLLDDGNILLFDNLGHFGAGGKSRILEIEPRSLGVAWRYTGTPERPFESVIRGRQQRLGNGNTLITESHRGRLLEVTPGGEVVWDYVNPVRRGNSGGHLPIVSAGARWRAEALTPSFREFIHRSEISRRSSP